MKFFLGLVLSLLSLGITAHPAGCNNANAGPGQTVCRHSIVALSAHGGNGVWTSAARNHDTIVFANPTDSITTASGFNGTGMDTLIWTVGGCSDTMLVTIAPNGGPGRTVSCAVLPGGSATMAGTGIGTWTILTGNPGTSAITTPTSPTTTITTFSTAGTYKYVWTTATCTDTVAIVVTAKPNTGPDQTVCRRSVVTLAAHGTGGFSEWLNLSANPDTITFSNPYDSSTTAIGFNGTGPDKLIWISNGCTDTMLVTIAPNGGPGRTAGCAVLPGGGLATMAGMGTGTWTALPGNPGTSTITTPASPTTTITTFSVSGTYRYIWNTGTCRDTVPVVVMAKPNGGPDQSICQYTSTTMAALGTGRWSSAPGNPDLVVFSNVSSPTTSVSNFSTIGTYTLFWSQNGCSDTVLVHVAARPNAGPDQTTCQYSTATMAAISTGTWTALATNPVATTIITPASPTTVISGFTVAGSYTYLWTSSGCPDTVNVVVNPKPNGGPNQTICANTTATMAATGIGTWSQLSNNPVVTTITNPASATTTVTHFVSIGVYNFVWTVNGCADTIAISVTTGGPDTIIYCYGQDTAHLHALGTGVWSIAVGNPGTSMLINPDSANAMVAAFSDSGTYRYIWTVPGCSDTVKVKADSTCPPPNDNVNTPTGLGTLPAPFGICGQGAPVTMAGTNVGATASVPYPYQGACLVNSNNYPNDVWYTFVASGYTAIIKITGGTGTLSNPMIDVWQGVPGSLSGLGCVIGSGGSASINIYNLIIGNTYYIQVAGSNGNQNGGFNLSVSDSIDCTGCFHTGSITATPPPANNSYSPGQTVQFCFSIPNYDQYVANWLHGIQPTFGTGWDTTTLTIVSTSSSCDGSGTWGWYPTGIFATRGNGSNIPYPRGWYYSSSRPNGFGGPGNNYGDDCTNFNWVFCLSVTTAATCHPGSDLSITFNTTGDGESGGWGSYGCSNDHGVTFFAVGSCCPPILSGTDPTCGNNNGVIKATPVAGGGPWTYSWIDTANNFSTTHTAVAGIDSITGLAPGTYTLRTLDSFQCPATSGFTITDTTSANAGPDQTVCQYTSATLTGTSGPGPILWTALSTNPSATTIASPTLHTTAVTGFNSTGIYKFVLTSGICTDTTSMTVTAKPNAGPDQAICLYASTRMATTGAGMWSALVTNPSVTTIDTPSYTNTGISNFVDTGVYKFIWTNSNGCTDTMAVHVTPAANAGPDQTVPCILLPGGSATMAATGTGTWTALASNPSVPTITTPSSPTTTITGFNAAGTYAFVWTSGTCTDTASVLVTLKPNAGPDQVVTCYPGDSIATMAASGTGTWSQYIYNPGTANIINPGSPTTIITSYSTAGVYSFIWTSGPCSDTATVTVTNRPNAGISQTVSCAPLPGGSTTMAATGSGIWSSLPSNPGTATITSPDSARTTITNFSAAGTYAFVWTNIACSDTTYIVVTAKPNAGPAQTVSCVVLPGGTAAMAAIGAGTWTVQSGNPGAATITNATNPFTTITNFTATGTYYFIWTNPSNCADTVAVVVTAHPNAGPDRTVTCVLLPGGTATMGATGAGTWTTQSGNPGTATITAPATPNTTITTFSAPGIYSFIWTNPAGCPDTANVTVTARPNAGPGQTVSCIILPGGTATMAAIGAGTWTAQSGNPGTAAITTPASAGTTITGFTAAGTYHYIWTNASGCADTTAIVVTAKPNAGPDQTVICALLPGGSSTMAATGLGTWAAQSGNPGTATITIPASATTTITTYTAPGVYSFIWTNASGCTDTATVTVTQEPTITLANAAYCLGGNTTLTPIVAPAGGTFLWSTTEVAPSIYVDTTVTSVFNVTYTLGTCSASTLNTVTVYPLPLATVTTIPSVCTAGNGLAITNPSAGTPGYTYSWSAPGGIADTMSNLSPNNYQVTVTDTHQCTVTASGTVGLQTPDIFVTEVSQHNLKCFNDATGDIYISTRDTARNSGAYIMTYAWSNASAGQNLINVQAGPYSVTVTDQFGCTGTISETLTQPTQLAASTTFTNPQCFGYADGTATLAGPTGGSGSYHYAWSTTPVQNTPLATGLLAGTYTVSLTDDSACLLTKNVTLTNPLQIAFAPPVLVEPSCFGFSNGSILVTPQNGFIPYTYVWNTNPVQTTDSAIGLIAGTYSVTVTDVNSCTATETIPLGQPLLLTVSIAPVNIRCFGYNDGSGTALPSGGTAPYFYVWSNQDTTQTISNLVIGTYGVTVTDNNACTTSSSTTLTQPTPVAEVLSAIRTSCVGAADGQVFDTASGGVGPFTYTLDTNGTAVQPANTTGIFTGLTSGLYTVVATDHNGCPVSDTITVPHPLDNYYTDTAISTSCYGTQYQDGIIHLQGYTIPNGPFLYSIDGGQLQYTPDFYHLPAGPHTIQAKDNFGCDTTFTVVVGEPPPPSLQILPGDSTIAPGATIQLGIAFSPYSADSIKGYLWSPGTGLSCIDCPAPVASPYTNQTVYTLVVTYNQGCVDTAFIHINTNGKPPVYIPNAFTPNGNGVNDVWYVFGTGIKDIKIMVFDRWGEKVFESDNQSLGWDGTYRGQAQSPGLFIYLVKIVYLDGHQEAKQGSLTLIR
jgi:gliding motility-associated-like protein